MSSGTWPKMDSSKNAVVLGASGNVGGAALKSLLETGYRVLAPYRSPDSLTKIKKVDLVTR